MSAMRNSGRRSLLAITLAIGSLGASSSAYTLQPPQPKLQGVPAKPSQDVTLLDEGEYTNADGKRIHSPAHTAGDGV